MKKKEAAIYKALAECGFEIKGEIEDTLSDDEFDNLLDPEAQFLDEVEQLFSSNNKSS